MLTIIIIIYYNCMTQEKLLTLTRVFNCSCNHHQYDVMPPTLCWRQTGTLLGFLRPPPSSPLSSGGPSSILHQPLFCDVIPDQGEGCIVCRLYQL